MAEKALLEVGQAVKVVDGPFHDFDGTLAEVKPQEGKVRLLTSLFGRVYPLELDFLQVEKS
jgi:transcription termination/antitermination protein NusG